MRRIPLFLLAAALPSLLANVPATAQVKPRRPTVHRPADPAVDLADPSACYRDLADLAGFPRFCPRPVDHVFAFDYANIGWTDGEQLTSRLLDTAVRTDHLGQSKDSQLRQAAADVNDLDYRSSCLNWANQDVGYTDRWFHTTAVRLAVKGFLEIGADSLNSPPGDTVGYNYDANGHSYSFLTRSPD